MIKYFDLARINSGPFLFKWRYKEIYKCHKCAKNASCEVYQKFNHIAAEDMSAGFNCDSYEARSCMNCRYLNQSIMEDPCFDCDDYYSNWIREDKT